MAARARALAGAGAAASSSGAWNSACSSARMTWLSCLQQHFTCLQQRLFAAALACSRACLCSTARFRYVWPRKNASQTVRNRGLLLFIRTGHRREIIVVSLECPDRSRRTVLHRGLVRFINMVHRRESVCCTVFLGGNGNAP